MTTATTTATQKMGRKKRFEAGRYEDNVTVLSVKMTREYREWIKRFAKHLRINDPNLVDHALVAFAKANGFDPPPER